MTPTRATIRTQPERQTKAARQLRGESLARGFASAVERLSNLAHRVVHRVQRLVHPEALRWPGSHRTPRV